MLCEEATEDFQQVVHTALGLLGVDEGAPHVSCASEPSSSIHCFREPLSESC